MGTAELRKIKESIERLSIEEFEMILFDCGIESIKPSDKSGYVKCLNILADTDYRKNITQYFLQDEYFVVEEYRQEVA